MTLHVLSVRRRHASQVGPLASTTLSLASSPHERKVGNRKQQKCATLQQLLASISRRYSRCCLFHSSVAPACIPKEATPSYPGYLVRSISSVAPVKPSRRSCVVRVHTILSGSAPPKPRTRPSKDAALSGFRPSYPIRALAVDLLSSL